MRGELFTLLILSRLKPGISMAIVQLAKADLRFGNTLILDEADFEIERGEKVALLGRNGQGKSTLLKLIQGQFGLGGGNLFIQNGIRVAYLPQEVPDFVEGKISDWVGQGFGEIWKTWLSYNHAVQTGDMNGVEKGASLLDEEQAWGLEAKVLSMCQQMGLDPEGELNQLSGGNKRRVLLAEALLAAPDLLLLDEPTNHLDIESIAAIERTLLSFNGAFVLVSHDRAFMQKTCTEILELDRGKLYRYHCRYDDFLKHREERLHAENLANQQFDKKLAEEEVWIRKGIQARRTRNMGRVRALLDMREERKARREKQGQVKMNLQEAEKSGRQVLDIKDLSFSYSGEGKRIVHRLNWRLNRGDKVALIGPNGCGKSTLLKLFLGQLQADEGEVVEGTQVQWVYFDQLREQLDLEKNVAENVLPHAEFIEVNGAKRHIMSYLQDFLFSSDRARSPVKVLSGGERNRLLLARLFLQPFNLLVLDEPTNDLDMESLEILEERLMDYRGTLILVSHDRNFIDNVAISTLAFEGEGVWKEYVGGYQDYLRQRNEETKSSKNEKVLEKDIPSKVSAQVEKDSRDIKVNVKRKLSYKETRELEELPDKIERSENEIELLQQQMQDPEFYKRDPKEIQESNEKLESLEMRLMEMYERFEELSN